MKVARLLLADGDGRGFACQVAVFHCHQAVEKFLKALLVNRGIIPQKIHDLPALLSKLDRDAPREIQRGIEELNPHYLYPRYPDLKFMPSFHFTYNKRNVGHLLDTTETICRWLKQQFKKP